MEIKIYTEENKLEWDNFVRDSKNGTFLICRDFMEYHSNRFQDHSLLFYNNNKLLAVMPGHISDKNFCTHLGLTYGGLIMSTEISMLSVLNIFEHLIVTLRNQGIKKILYKSIPHIYHKLPAEEDLYALFRYKAKLSERNISSTILLSEHIAYSRSRKNGLKKAEKELLYIKESNDLETFWNILNNNLLAKYNKQAVHSLSEISYLKDKFPEEIRLYAAFDSEDKMLGGCLTFEMQQIVHAQYTAATAEGKQKGSIDLIINHIANSSRANKTYFDYGTSTESNGFLLNENLIYQKEGFGARGIVYDTYVIDL